MNISIDVDVDVVIRQIFDDTDEQLLLGKIIAQARHDEELSSDKRMKHYYKTMADSLAKAAVAILKADPDR